MDSLRAIGAVFGNHYFPRGVERYELSVSCRSAYTGKVADKVAANLSIISDPPLIPGFSPSPKPNMSGLHAPSARHHTVACRVELQ
jgi:hypothetical protein